jgi:epoxide hydrolase-like predicted phosphatase
MAGVEAVISDFGGVLTSPLSGSFAVFEQTSGVPLEELGKAMIAVGERAGANPLFELETGRLSEREFLGALAEQLTTQLGRPIDLDGFGERYFESLDPNDAMIDYMRELRRRGYKLAICTNNVREWEARWRAMLPIDEIFDVVVDSAFVGTRKPEPEIYELTLARLGVSAPAAVMIDDIETNCDGARAVGLQAVLFKETQQAIDAVEAILDGAGSRGHAGA